MPPPPPVADLAGRDGARQAALADLAVAALDLHRAGADPVQWRDAVADAAPTLLAVQETAVSDADPYLDEVIAAQGADPAAEAAVNPGAFVDQTDGGGSWVRNLVYAPPSAYRDAVSAGAGDTAARARAGYVARAIVTDGVLDAGRAARLVAMATRPSVRGYVRALRGTSCARCAVLAGRRYRVSSFRRHPRCDCYMIPAAEDAPDDWATDVAAYFRSLTRVDQDRIFTAAGAEAIRLGGVKAAAINQVVNAADGVTVVGGRAATTSGTSVRGLYGGYEVQPDGSLRERTRAETERRPSGDRTLRVATTPRLMPDEIFQLAETEGWDRAELLRQLRRFAYIV